MPPRRVAMAVPPAATTRPPPLFTVVLRTVAPALTIRVLPLLTVRPLLVLPEDTRVVVMAALRLGGRCRGQAWGRPHAAGPAGPGRASARRSLDRLSVGGHLQAVTSDHLQGARHPARPGCRPSTAADTPVAAAGRNPLRRTACSIITDGNETMIAEPPDRTAAAGAVRSRCRCARLIQGRRATAAERRHEH